MERIVGVMIVGVILMINFNFTNRESHEIKATEENHTLTIEPSKEGIFIFRADDLDGNTMFFYPSQYQKIFNILEDEIIKIERAKETARVEERERKKEQAHAQEEERKDLIFEENQARAEQEQAQKQADLNLSKICEGYKNV